MATNKLLQKKHEQIKATLRELYGQLQETLDDESRQSEHERTLQKIEIAKAELAELAEDLTEEKSLTKQLTWSEEKVTLDNLIKENHIGYLLEADQFIYCMGMQSGNKCGVVNPHFRTLSSQRIVPVLNKMGNCSFSADIYKIKKYFQMSGNDYYGMTGSFNHDKWDPKKLYNKMGVIRQFWVQPDYDHAAEYNLDFDFLLHCVGGGKQENIDHLEQWIAYKWLHPERNANMPNLDLGGYPGGNGKGRLIELTKTIFTHGCVSAATLKELDSFNAQWETAVILYYDEPGSTELPENKLKNVTGSEDQRIEKKGIDAYMADRNYSLIFASNNTNGVVKLAGTGASGEDRRWSVLNTDLVMVDQIMVGGWTQQEAKVRTNDINNLLKNRAEVAKWLAHIIQKHQLEDKEYLGPLHGVDYQKRFEDQKTSLDAVFDQLLPILKQTGRMPISVATDIAQVVLEQPKLMPRTVKTKFERYLTKNKIQFHSLTKQRTNIEWEGGYTDDVLQGHVICVDLTKTSFDYSLVSKKPWSKHISLEKENCLVTV
jgi:hypothetical protein